ncbi:hypothetical protein H8L32_04655 [Undibacterium sp. CY18W]|uniref:Uncharacterized protein n=1 Tax=Undibacterium hunanense TaxID=2762292 RepID=A0ABR6ZLH5_9BURK|nr:hypothetical protein [Undibacterium hunanense]MBC3916756.1 hypothetical protein [Undibacterium hunanense]
MIKVTQLQFEYGHKRVYDDFSLTLAQPGLFDQNGSGKSTLLKILSGLLFTHGGSVAVPGYLAIPWGCVFKQSVVQRGERWSLLFTRPATEGMR